MERYIKEGEAMNEEYTEKEKNALMEELRYRAVLLLDESIEKAWKSLSQGKFSMFGYWAAKTVQMRELLGISHESSPFNALVKIAMERVKGD